MLKEKRRSSNELNELQEGDTYASGIELRNDKEVEDEIIPTCVPLPSDERIKQKENLLFVSVDLEISTSDHNTEVTQLSAVSPSGSEFNQYVLPEQPMDQR